jgi:hypothetical protein
MKKIVKEEVYRAVKTSYAAGTLCAILTMFGCKSIPQNTIEGGSIMNIDINKKAPVIARQEIIVNASIEKVRSKLTDIDNWVSWRSSIIQSQLLGPINEGTNFKWKSDGLSYNSKIHTYNNNAFGWTGTTTGAYAVHNWYFTEENGKTTVKVEESLEGFIIRIIKKSMQKKLLQMMEKDLMELKVECEK